MAKKRDTSDAFDVELIAMRRRWWLTLVGIIALLLLAFFYCPLSIALMKILPPALEPWLGASAFGIPLLCLVTAFVLLLTMPRRSRAQAVAHHARRLGLVFEARPSRLEFQGLQSLRYLATVREQLRSHQTLLVLATGSDVAANLVTGEIDGTAVWIVDYSTYKKFAGGKADEQTVFCLPHGAPGTPDLIVTPRSWADRFADCCGSHGVALPGEEDFMRRFFVGGADPVAVQRCLSRPVLVLLLELGNLTIEVKDGDLIALRWNTLAPARTIAAMVANLRVLGQLLGADQGSNVLPTVTTDASEPLRQEQIREGEPYAGPLVRVVFQDKGSAGVAPRPLATAATMDRQGKCPDPLEVRNATLRTAMRDEGLL